MAENARPVFTVRVGRVKACVWENETKENGSMYNVTLHRVYRLDTDQRGKNDSGWRQTSSFGRDDLLTVAFLAGKAFEWIAQTQQEQQVEDREAA